MTKPILELKDVQTTVKTADGEIVPILKGINLEIRPGDFITIIGTNGAGKSTLFNTIAGSLKPDSGILRHNGQDITKMSEEKRTQFIGRVFQDPKMGTAPRMTVIITRKLLIHMMIFQMENIQKPLIRSGL